MGIPQRNGILYHERWRVSMVRHVISAATTREQLNTEEWTVA